MTLEIVTSMSKAGAEFGFMNFGSCSRSRPVRILLIKNNTVQLQYSIGSLESLIVSISTDSC